MSPHTNFKQAFVDVPHMETVVLTNGTMQESEGGKVVLTGTNETAFGQWDRPVRVTLSTHISRVVVVVKVTPVEESSAQATGKQTSRGFKYG